MNDRSIGLTARMTHVQRKEKLRIEKTRCLLSGLFATECQTSLGSLFLLLQLRQLSTLPYSLENRAPCVIFHMKPEANSMRTIRSDEISLCSKETSSDVKKGLSRLRSAPYLRTLQSVRLRSRGKSGREDFKIVIKQIRKTTYGSHTKIPCHSGTTRVS